MQEERLQSKAKAVADCVVEAQEGEMSEAGREGGVKTDEESVQEVGQTHSVASKWEGEIRWNMRWRPGSGPATRVEKM